MRQIICVVGVGILLLCVTCIGAGTSSETLGIAPQDEEHYASKVIKCKDGSKKFTRDQLNDDFCDCPDGTDEPGTSACPEGKFYCRNTGHTSIMIFSSRVNDGICDCCDGSDEYDGKANCSNTCWEAGKVARERLKKKIAIYQEGVKIRRREVGKATDAFAKDEAELSKLKNEEKVLNGLVQKLKEKKEQIEKVEEQERLKREEEQILKESEKNATEHTIQPEETSNDDGKKIQAGDLGSSTNNEMEFGDDSTIKDADYLHVRPLSTAGHEVNQHVEEEKTGAIKLETTNDAHHEVNQHVEEKKTGAIKLETTNDAQTAHDGSMLEAESTEDEATYPATSKEAQVESSSEELSKEELGRLVASRWTGETVDPKTDDTDVKTQEEPKDDLEYPENAEGEDFAGYNTETDDDRHKYGDEDEDDDDYRDSNDHDEHGRETYHSDSNNDPEFEHSTESPDFSFSSSSSWLGKIQQTVQNILQKVNIFKSPVNTTEAAHVRKEYDHASSKLSKLQSRVTSLTEKLKHDFGKEREYFSFYDRCFEIKQNKYVYKVCPYKQASQVDGHSTTRLGKWERFEENFRVMQFSNGDKCWNGPDRSLKVRLRCGLKDELTDVDEPSRCEYTAFLSTPLVCTEEKLKELESKQELWNASQTPVHDEF